MSITQDQLKHFMGSSLSSDSEILSSLPGLDSRHFSAVVSAPNRKCICREKKEYSRILHGVKDKRCQKDGSLSRLFWSNFIACRSKWDHHRFVCLPSTFLFFYRKRAFPHVLCLTSVHSRRINTILCWDFIANAQTIVSKRMCQCQHCPPATLWDWGIKISAIKAELRSFCIPGLLC